jgi:hypothetical protein
MTKLFRSQQLFPNGLGGVVKIKMRYFAVILPSFLPSPCYLKKPRASRWLLRESQPRVTQSPRRFLFLVFFSGGSPRIVVSSVSSCHFRTISPVFLFFDGAKKAALEKWRGKKNSFVNMLKVVNTFVELNFEMICWGDDLQVMGVVTPWEGRNQGGSLKIHWENSKEGKLDLLRLKKWKMPWTLNIERKLAVTF